MNSNTYVEKITDFCKNLDIDIAKNVIAFDSISSTNFKAKELAQNGKEEGTVVISRVQTKGRGRFDRKWESPEGGLYFSIILRPQVEPDKTTLLPLIAALSICETIIALNRLSAAIKWPNDVRINGKKVAGILLESEADGNKIDFVILGIGVNLNTDVTQLSPELKSTSTTIAHELNQSVDCYEFLKHLFLTLDKHYSIFLNQDINSILSEWKKHSDTLGRKVRIITSSDETVGTAFDIDESGFLIIETDLGVHKKITSGDCFYFE